jgi:hypothetical protein
MALSSLISDSVLGTGWDGEKSSVIMPLDFACGGVGKAACANGIWIGARDLSFMIADVRLFGKHNSGAWSPSTPPKRPSPRRLKS